MHGNAEDDLFIENLMKNIISPKNWAKIHRPWSILSYFQNTFKTWSTSNEYRRRLPRNFQPAQLLLQVFLDHVQEMTYLVNRVHPSDSKAAFLSKYLRNRLFSEHGPEKLATITAQVGNSGEVVFDIHYLSTKF